MPFMIISNFTAHMYQMAGITLSISTLLYYETELKCSWSKLPILLSVMCSMCMWNVVARWIWHIWWMTSSFSNGTDVFSNWVAEISHTYGGTCQLGKLDINTNILFRNLMEVWEVKQFINSFLTQSMKSHLEKFATQWLVACPRKFQKII